MGYNIIKSKRDTAEATAASTTSIRNSACGLVVTVINDGYFFLSIR